MLETHPLRYQDNTPVLLYQDKKRTVILVPEADIGEKSEDLTLPLLVTTLISTNECSVATPNILQLDELKTSLPYMPE